MDDKHEVTSEEIIESLKGSGFEVALSENVKADAGKTVEVDDIEEEALDKPKEIVYSETEKEAMAIGWKPDAGPKSAEEFLRAAPLYNRIKKDGKKIEELEKTLHELKSLISKQNEMSYKKALKELQVQKRDAISLGDIDAVTNIDNEIRSHEAALREHSTPAAPPITPEVEAFAERHKSWLHGTSYEAHQMREFAHQRDQELTRYNMTPEEHLKVIENELKERFKNHFVSNEVPSAAVVESDSAPVRSAPAKSKFSFKDLNAAQKQVAKYFSARGVMTTEDYIKQLVELGELK